MFREMWVVVCLLVVSFCGLGYAGEIAVISTTDYSSGNLAVLAEGASEAQVDVLPICSDNALFSYAGDLYVLERFGADNIIKVDGNDLSPSGVVYQYSVGNGANPHGIAFVSDQKAYVTRYADTKLWIINPSAASEAAFRIGEIDLSEYADADGFPEMSAMVLVDGKLYVGLQRLDQNTVFWDPLDAKVLVIDTATDVVIKAIDLEKGNPQAMAAFGGKLYVTCGGNLSDPTDGSIEVIDIETNTHAGVLTLESDLGGNVGALVLRSANKGYVIVGGYLQDAKGNWMPSYVVRPFDPSDGTIEAALIGSQSATSMELGGNGVLYVADRSTNWPGIYTYDADDILVSSNPIATGLPPSSIAFVGESGAVAVEESVQQTPLAFALGANYPNPFNAATVIPYTVEHAGDVRLSVYDELGRYVATLVQDVQIAGRYVAQWNGRSEAGAAVASGFYLVRLETARQIATSKVLFLK
ncbi:MAG: T9SS type A sorting domain-containing protein [Candidatus Latescibacterota bacterium]